VRHGVYYTIYNGCKYKLHIQAQSNMLYFKILLILINYDD